MEVNDEECVRHRRHREEWCEDHGEDESHDLVCVHCLETVGRCVSSYGGSRVCAVLELVGDVFTGDDVSTGKAVVSALQTKRSDP